MKKQFITIGIIILFVSIELSGCTETKKTIEPLTDADWNYFVWQHNSTDTITYYMTTSSNLTSKITKYIQNASFFELEDTVQIFTKLNATAYKWNQIILQNSYDNSKFNLSSRMNENRNIYALWLIDNRNISNIYLLMCNQFFLNDTSLRSIMVDYMRWISNNMTSAQNHLNTIINWFNSSISDEEWNNWTKGRDWSFLDRQPS
jgi:hypothetical protein